MSKYILKRIGYMLLVFFVVSFLMFSVYNLIPSDPARAQLEPLRQTLKPDEFEQRYLALRESMGLDAPIVVRYARWMGLIPDVNGEFDGLLEGNFGYSQVYKKDVIEVIPDRMANTIFINIFRKDFINITSFTKRFIPRINFCNYFKRIFLIIIPI